MTIRPILFSGPMVRALLEGRKTQTRRVLTPQPVKNSCGLWCASGPKFAYQVSAKLLAAAHPLRYAQGDLLYVRETWASHWANDDIPPSQIKAGNWSTRYDADGAVSPAERDGSKASDDQFLKKRPGIHMPRWASRLTLKVTGVRVQRVQEISEEDAAAEGVQADGRWPHQGAGRLENFERLWDSLNEKRGFGWDVNPWVVALTFEVHHCNVDQFEREAA